LKPIVALIGRQNVGKSTLLNRIAGKPIAIIEDFPGTTRDRVIADVEWEDRAFTLVDTGGLEFEDKSEISESVRTQVSAAIGEADLIVFITDASTGIMPDDYEIAEILRKSNKPVILTVNKADNEKLIVAAAEFFQLGFDVTSIISAYHGRKIAVLMDKINELLPPEEPEPETPEGIKLAIVGRPNVGKSMLINRLTGQNTSIVSSIPGTTRDAIDTAIDFNGQNIILIDTAGIRRRGRVEKGIEWLSVLRAMRALERADIGFLVIDATEPLTAQDMHVAGYVEKAGKGMAVLVNKWDIAVEKNKTVYDEYIRNKLKFAPYAPILYISAKKGQGVNKIMPLAIQLQQERFMKIPDADVNKLIKEAYESHTRPRQGKKFLKLYSASQSGVNPPTFRFDVNDPKIIHFSYQRFLENRIREVYGFRGTPIRLVFKGRG
jgi:GTPase